MASYTCQPGSDQDRYMPDPIANPDLSFAMLAAEQRPRLVNLCAYLTGNREAAEDLAQESLIEAWRNRSKLSNLPGAAKWLSVVARHMCLRWLRAEGRQAPGGHGSHNPIDPEPDLENLPVDAPDLEMELEREELADLLDQALAQLPAGTRDALIHKYILEMPQAEIAAQLGLSEGAVEARLQRGKLSLRRLLQTDLRADANAFGLFQSPSDGWQPTRIWCPICGQHKLYGQLPRGSQDFQLHCPHCSWEPRSFFVQSNPLPEFEGVSGYKALLHRFRAYMYRYLVSSLREGRATCRRCGQPVGLSYELPPHIASYPGFSRRGVSLKCQACGATSYADIYGLALDTPGAVQFWRQHPRIRTLPEQPLEAEGQAAWRICFQSETDRARLDVLLAQDRYEVLGVYPGHDGG
jgi:RNA polymerase sigma factor (sigma-70 family)